MRHFMPEQVRALPDDGYTSDPTKVRIVREGDEERPWVVDGYDAHNGAFTVQVWTFATFDEAVAAIPEFVRLITGPPGPLTGLESSPRDREHAMFIVKDQDGDGNGIFDTIEEAAAEYVQLAQWWVHVERDPVGRQEPSGRYTTEWDEVPDVLVGPYETVEAATLAMNESLLVRGLVEENALDCYVEPLDVQVIDPLNPDHTGGPNH